MTKMISNPMNAIKAATKYLPYRIKSVVAPSMLKLIRAPYTNILRPSVFVLLPQTSYVMKQAV